MQGSWDMKTDRRGKTEGHAEVPLEDGLLILSARGSNEGPAEFRVILTAEPMQETRTTTTNPLTVITFVIGQNSNTRGAVGLGNPFRVPVATTKSLNALAPDDTVGGEYWFYIDWETGMAAMGGRRQGTLVGENCLADSVTLVARIPEAKGVRWRLATVSNWTRPVTVATIPRASRPRLKLLRAQHKFDRHCQAIPVYGVTTVCPIEERLSLHRIMTAIRERFLSNPLLGPHYAFTDPAGYHMTLTGLEVQGFKLVSALSDDQKDELGRRLGPSLIREASQTTFQMLAIGLTIGKTIKIALEPADDPSRALVEGWRERVPRAVADRVWDTVAFHATIAYEVYPVRGEEAQAALARETAECRSLLQGIGDQEVGPIRFAAYRDMHAFPPIDFGFRIG